MLTDKEIRAARPESGSYRLRDGRGLNLRVYPNGRKAWEFQFSLKSKRKRKREQPTKELGDYGSAAGCLGLKEARSAAQRCRDLVRAGVDPRKAPAGGGEGGEVASAVIESWYRLNVADEFRRPEQIRVLLDRHLLPALGERPIASIKRGDLFLLVAGIKDGSANRGRPAPRVAAQVLQYVKRIFAYAVSAGFLETSPAEGIKAKDLGLSRKPKERNLSFAELALFVRWLWSEACFASPTVRALLQILVLTGCRTGEALGAQWQHVDFGANTWTIPPGDAERRAKSERQHVIHLSDEAKAVFAALPRFSITDAAGALRPSPWAFASPLDPARPIDEKAAARVVRRAFDTEKRKPANWRPVTKGRGKRSKLPAAAPLAGIAEFSPHDLRRTFRSRLADLGIAPHVAEKCLNHELGGVLAIYDRGEYLPERAAAFALWGRKVAALLRDEGEATTNVVELRTA